jgi:hypothetical protein
MYLKKKIYFFYSSVKFCFFFLISNSESQRLTKLDEEQVYFVEEYRKELEISSKVCFNY